MKQSREYIGVGEDWVVDAGECTHSLAAKEQLGEHV